jgi:hypothetical protein
MIDPVSDMPHIWNHDVSETEVAEIHDDPIEDRPGRQGTRIALGKTHGGRFLRIVYSRSPDRQAAFVITAYVPAPRVIHALRRRMRHHP